MLNNLSEMTVLVTGGTKGIGRATVESFVKAGATVYGTYFWGDNLDELESYFSQYINRPVFLQADISDEETTTQLIETIAQENKKIDILILNAAFAPQFKDTYKFRGLLDSIEHNSWPLITYIDCIKQHFGQYPGYVVAITSEGHRSCHITGYDYVAASKAVLETLTKYIGARENIIINCISPGVVDTEAFELVFGKKAQAFIRKFDPDFIVSPEAVGNVSVALCSGLMDAVRGQVITVDNGRMFTDNFTKWIEMIETHFVEK
ncbi:SDR family oxidoreductase [Yersinia pekkanenii]|uniref:Short chain dehydrogenase n=1 Tax=Yersinia pekkanenii TaxID=1288385 RepID=A0A0T9NHR3_9GAMM|nr:SDR family oxidoreductase [Yersinia pekkanenii]CNH10903.1 putative short chain dehydrogenase [Yersinia pekkanenii]CRY64798.1 putative short chain dehydrogenase [Yersinia pekkanenii]